MHITTSLAVLTAVFTAFNGVHARGDFSHTCGSFGLDNNFLRATCGNGQGQQVNSALNLNACIGADPNALICRPNGNYAVANGCSTCWIDNLTFMICDCGGPKFKVVDLDECIANRGGLLVCA